VREKKEQPVAEILQLFENTKKSGLLIGKGGLNANVFRITPPMTVEKTQIDQAVKILDQSFEEIKV
jgi:4-aminobutyrate aminotransferase-like enzyme